MIFTNKIRQTANNIKTNNTKNLIMVNQELNQVTIDFQEKYLLQMCRKLKD